MTPEDLARLSATGRQLYLLRDDILKKWEERVGIEVPEARHLPRPLLLDTLPAFIDALAKALSPHFKRSTAVDFSTIAEEHGGERARLTSYTIESLIHEHHTLKEVTLGSLRDKIELSPEEELIVQHSIDAALRESATTFALAQSRLREQFIATITHDLRSPLSVIKMAAEIAQDEIGDTRALAALLERIIKNAERADRMIRDLLDAALLRGGSKMVLKPGPSEMRHVIEDVVSQLTLVHGERFDIVGEPVAGYWDSEALRRAIENLCNNAVKYGRPGSRIRISVREEIERVILEIHNDGPAIPVEEQESIFQVFRRAAASREGSQNGWGLGLALVRGVAEAHAGSIGLESQEGSGTTFMLDIPVDIRATQKTSARIRPRHSNDHSAAPSPQ